jgi:hypothetical protein
MLRAGRTYTFEELVALFEDVRPRSSIGSRRARLLSAAQPAPELSTAFAPEVDAAIAPASSPGHDDSPPATPRFRLNIVP